MLGGGEPEGCEREAARPQLPGATWAQFPKHTAATGTHSRRATGSPQTRGAAAGARNDCIFGPELSRPSAHGGGTQATRGQQEELDHAGLRRGRRTHPPAAAPGPLHPIRPDPRARAPRGLLCARARPRFRHARHGGGGKRPWPRPPGRRAGHLTQLRAEETQGKSLSPQSRSFCCRRHRLQQPGPSASPPPLRRPRHAV